LEPHPATSLTAGSSWLGAELFQRTLLATDIIPLVYALDSDITIESSDGVLFELYERNLKMGLGKLEFIKPNNENQIVHLSEDSVILELLFQFCYPDRHPDLENLPFTTLSRLAEAVEKYNVFSGIPICKIRMKYSLSVFSFAPVIESHHRNNLPHEAFDIFLYGANHNYTDVMAMAAPLVVLSTPLSKVVPALPVQLHGIWVRNGHFLVC
jgi:hypothetical protein